MSWERGVWVFIVDCKLVGEQFEFFCYVASVSQVLVATVLKQPVAKVM